MVTRFKQLLFGIAALGAAGSTFAVSDYDKPSVTFSCVLGDCATDLSGQLSLQIIGDKNGEDPAVYFKFFNNVGVQSSITQISFDGLSNIEVLHSIPGSNPVRGTGPGTEFQHSFQGPGLTIADPLLAGSVPFHADWTVRSVGAGGGGNGGVANGINASNEWFEIVLASGNYLDYLHAIQSGDIRIGLVTEGYANGLSATYLTTVVPEPGTYALLLAGLLGVSVARLRKDS